MAPKRKPTFLLLPESHIFSAEKGPRMLGALCEQMDDPTAGWKPNDVSQILSAKFSEADTAHQPLEVVMDSAQQAMEQTRSSAARAALEGLLEASWRRGYPGTTFQISSQQIRTVRLQQHKDIFKAILDNDEVKEFRKENDDNPYFMIIGYKSCLNATVQHVDSRKSDAKVGVTVPIEPIVTAATGGVPVPPGLLPDIGASGRWSTSWTTLSRGTLKGEYIYAVEYREILRRSWIERILQWRRAERDSRREIEARAHAQPRDRAMYGGGRGHEDEDSGGSESESESEDEIPDVAEYMDQSWVMDEEGDDKYVLGMEVNEDGEPSKLFV